MPWENGTTDALLQANDEYVLLAIGNAPWPMGVTSIGIHERAARTKIFVDKVARTSCLRKGCGLLDLV